MTIESDPGLREISKVNLYAGSVLPITPTVIDEKLVEIKNLDCGNCRFAQGVEIDEGQRESAAEYNRYVTYEDGLQEGGSRHNDERDERLGREIRAVKAGKVTCRGLIEKTIETTYNPFEYSDANRVKKLWMRMRLTDTAVYTRKVTVCSNTAVPSALEAGVRFTAPYLRPYYM